jgi:thiopeptide-type bacteriocin biosynthesis protein
VTLPTTGTVPSPAVAGKPADLAPAAETGPGDWIAIHIFYAANPRPLIVQCLAPLIKSLDSKGLLHGYFYINYWLEGPHIRLRLRSSSARAAEPVRRETEDALAAFLRARPALYEVKSEFLVDLYNTLFEMEFMSDERAKHCGPDGRMRLRQNNTFSYETYEPEYGKYGGPAGVELAEWHFRHSTDLTIDAVAMMNLHIRTVLLGVAAQLMMVMSACFLPDHEVLADYLQRYHDFWHSASAGTELIAAAGYDRNYDNMADLVTRRFAEIQSALRDADLEGLPGFLRTWAEHCIELRDRARALATAGELVFRSWDGTRDLRVSDPDAALQLLLSPYLHMTNNRLHATMRDEAYLSYVLARSLRDAAAAASGAANAASAGAGAGPTT